MITVIHCEIQQDDALKDWNYVEYCDLANCHVKGELKLECLLKGDVLKCGQCGSR